MTATLATPSAASPGHRTIDRRTADTDARPVVGGGASPSPAAPGAHTASGARCGQRRGGGAPAAPAPAPPDPGSGRGRVRTVQRDGTVVWTTPILEYQPVLTSQDYAVLARLRDQARADIARRTTGLPDAA